MKLNYSLGLEPLVDKSTSPYEEDKDLKFQLPFLTTGNNRYIDLKNLDNWDEQHLKLNTQDKSSIIKRKAPSLLQKSSLMCLNYKSSANTTFTNLKSTAINNNLNDFYRNLQQETSSLLAQNINMVKKRFDFDIFKKKLVTKLSIRKDQKNQAKNKKPQEELYQIGNELAVRKMQTTSNANDVKYTTTIDNDEEISIQNRILKHNNLKLEGKYQKVVSSDYYKEIVKNKNILEKAYRKEIRAVAKNIELAQSELKQLDDELKELYAQIEEKKKKYYDSRDAYYAIENGRLNSNSNNNKREFVHQTQEAELSKRLKTQVEVFRIEYEQRKIANDISIELVKEEINNIKIGIKTLLMYKKSIIKQLTDYYYQILKEGVDVRSIGLCWVLTRLYEFNVPVANKDFPKFLEYISINYLMEYSQKAIIKKKLNVVLGLLVKKYLITPKNDNSKHNNEDIIRINSDYIELDNILDFLKKLKQKISNKIIMQNEMMLIKDKEIFQRSMNQLRDLSNYQNLFVIGPNMTTADSTYRREDGEKTVTTMAIAGKYKSNGNSFDETKEDLSVSHCNRNRAKSEVINQREIVDACTQIRIEIKRVDGEMALIKKEHMKYFKRKHECSKSKGISECVKYDLMFCALFGNYAVV